jgi:hypothetical protein
MPNSFSDKFSGMQSVAEMRLAGPRSVLLPSDPEGLGLWFEPVVRVLVRDRASGEFSNQSVYCVPNCLGREPNSAVLVRRATWNYREGRQHCMNEGRCEPSVEVAYLPITPADAVAVDSSLKGLDHALLDFSTPAEGLDLEWPSGTKPVQQSAAIHPPSKGYRIFRQFRHMSVEVGFPEWVAGPALTGSVLRLCDVLAGIRARNMHGPRFVAIERFEYSSEVGDHFRDYPID